MTPEQAREYQQVAGIVCFDVNILLDICETPGMTAESMLRQIRRTKNKMDEAINDRKSREERYQSLGMLLALPKQEG